MSVTVIRTPTDSNAFKEHQHMNIYQLLSSKPHNKRYLDRYYKFIEYCKEMNINLSDCYTEAHHILPRGEFEEYSSFRENPWNRINLTARQHFIAHMLLWKCFGRTQTAAFYAMSNESDFSINNRIYERLKKERSILISQVLTGKKKTEDHVNKINRNPEKIRKTAEAHTGMKRSIESRNKMKQSRKKYLSTNEIRNKNTVVYTNIITNERSYFNKTEIVSLDKDWVKGLNGPKKKCYWDGINPHVYKRYIPGFEPNGWVLGNPKNPNKRLDI